MAQIAISSSSPSTSYPHYDVFINHRGPDVKNTFASHLYLRLTFIGLRVFLDMPELVEGHTFPSQIEAAIQRADIHIAIFSPTYAESKWCLDELIDMIKSGATILPVFYKVKPSDLRWTGRDGRGEYAKALLKHEEEERYNSQTIQNWREALSTAANLSGFELQAFNGDEGKLLEKIVQRVLNKVDKRPLKFVAEHPTGLEEKLQEFESKVLQRQKEKVMGIVGPGGVGKTTLAKQYFSQRRSHYSRSCILYDVREKEKNGCLPSLQRKLLKDLTGLDLQIDSVHEGIEKLITHLSSSSSHLLIILDDVNDARQLEPFLPIKDIVNCNSLIVITSRDKKVLKKAKIAETAVYELKRLNKQHSEELFCRYAFQQPLPLPEFADLVDRFIKACDGLPLSLKVFGALVYGEYDKSYWLEKLNGLSDTLPNEIHERLKISYDSLSKKDQEIFLDIACFFIGEHRDTVIRICGSVGDLENKCLLEVDSGWIKMHDHIRDMGRRIAGNVSPHRLWDQTGNNMDDLLERSSCRITEVRGVKMKFVEENTRPLMTEMPSYERLSNEFFENYRKRPFDYLRFCGMLNLQFVEAEGGYLEQIVRRARAPHLQWIRWYNCTHSSLPSWIPMENLKVLEVCGQSKLGILWERKSQVPRQLRELIISAPLSAFPNSMVQLKHCVKIVIRNAVFKTLPKELCDVNSLESLTLESCSKMKSLPDSLAELRNLKELNIRNCPKLKCLPHSFGLLPQLTYLRISYCPKLKCLPDSFGLLQQVTGLTIMKCGIEYLPRDLKMNNLRYLIIADCPLRELPFRRVLPELERSACMFHGRACLIHGSICPNLQGGCPHLETLILHHCKELRLIPSLCGLPQLKFMFVQGCENLGKLSVETLISLLLLHVGGCAKLEKIEGLEQFRGLSLSLRSCPQIRELLGVEHCFRLSAEVVYCSKVEWLSLRSHFRESANDVVEYVKFGFLIFCFLIFSLESGKLLDLRNGPQDLWGP